MMVVFGLPLKMAISILLLIGLTSDRACSTFLLTSRPTPPLAAPLEFHHALGVISCCMSTWSSSWTIL